MKHLLVIIILIFIVSCSKKPDKLFYQLSPDSTVVIYKYQYNKTLFSKKKNGYKIAKSGQHYNEDLAEFSIDYIWDWKDGNTPIGYVNYSGFDSDFDSELSEFSVEIKTLKNALIIPSEYKFESLSVSRGYVQIDGIERVSGIPKYERTFFTNARVLISNNSDGYITQVETYGHGLNANEISIYTFIPKYQIHINDIDILGIFRQLDL